MKPTIIHGNFFSDERGQLTFNNDFDATSVKRIYTIENTNGFIRQWQGHKIEQRWFSAICGDFLIKLIEIDNWKKPSKNLEILKFQLSSEHLDFLHISPGFVSSIEATTENSKLLVLADYKLGEIQDEYRFASDYF